MFGLALLLTGCVEVHQIPERDGGPPPSTPSEDGGTCLPPPASCTVVDVVAGDTRFDLIDQDEIAMTSYGSWTHLSHPADVAATLYVESLAVAEGADEGESIGAQLALRAATSVELDEVLGFSFAHPGSFSFPLYAPEQDLFLYPTGASFRVRVCYEVRDPFPTCGREGAIIPSCTGVPSLGFRQGGGDACACLPRCETAADCPIPSTGDIAPVCNAHQQCALPCDASAQCPDGQSCALLPADLEFTHESICVTHL